MASKLRVQYPGAMLGKRRNSDAIKVKMATRLRAETVMTLARKRVSKGR